MPCRPKKSTSFPIKPTFPCPVQGCRTQIRSRWGFTQHIQAKHPGMVLKYPENEEELVQIPSSDVNQTSSLPSSPNTFSQNELDLDSIRLGSDQGPFDFDDNA